MGKPLVGEVAVLPFPQTDLQADKRRAAQPDRIVLMAILSYIVGVFNSHSAGGGHG